MFSVMADDLTTVTDATTAHEAWQALKDLYDRKTVNTTINLLKNISERKLPDGASLQDHLTGFHNNWIRLKDRSQQGRGELSRTLQALTASNEVKAAFLLISLPSSMDNIVDNLQTKERVTYEDVRAKLLDISANKSVATAGNSKTAYRVQRSGEASRPKSPEEKDCTWCRKRKMRSQGHTWNECRKLKAHNTKQREEKAQQVLHETRTEDSSPATAPMTSSSHSGHALAQPSPPMAVSVALPESAIFDLDAADVQEEWDMSPFITLYLMKNWRKTYSPVTRRG